MKPFLKPKTATPPEPVPQGTKVTPNELTIYAVAAAMADAAERAAYLDRACGEDVVLRQRVEERLASRPAMAELVSTSREAAPRPAVAILPMTGMQLAQGDGVTLPPRHSPFPWLLATLLAAAVGALTVVFTNERGARIHAESRSQDAAAALAIAERERETAEARALEARTAAQRTADQNAEVQKQREAAEAARRKAEEEAARFRVIAAKAEDDARKQGEESRKVIEETRRASAQALADTLGKLAAALVEEGRHAEAEGPARQALELRVAQGGDPWLALDARYILGAALMGRGNVVDAEKELLATVAGMEPLATSADAANRARLSTAVKKLSQLYSATGRRKEASEWRRKLDALPR